MAKNIPSYGPNPALDVGPNPKPPSMSRNTGPQAPVKSNSAQEAPPSVDSARISELERRLEQAYEQVQESTAKINRAVKRL